MVWYSHLLQNFPQFIVIHTVKGLYTLVPNKTATGTHCSPEAILTLLTFCLWFVFLHDVDVGGRRLPFQGEDS